MYRWDRELGDGTVEQTLVAAWQLSADPRGRADQILEFSQDMSAGRYMLTACSVANCGLEFSHPEPIGPPHGIVLPPIAWQAFSLSEATGQSPTEAPQTGGGGADAPQSSFPTARVDPVSAWDGLRLRSGPGTNYQSLYTMPANTTVKVLDGPEHISGILWYRVEDESTGQEGWVMGQYLLFDTDSGANGAEIFVPENRQRISFPSGSTITTLSANLSTQNPRAYELRALANQRMYIDTDRSGIELVVLDPNGNLLSPIAATSTGWEFRLPQTGDYIIIVQGQGSTRITVEIPPL
jgi:uncharacterized protein YraI